jgi:hypothetical protein
MTVILKDTDRNNTREFESRSEAQEAKAELVDKAGADEEALVIEVSDSHDTDSAANIAETPENDPREEVETHSVETVEAEPVSNPEQLSKDPIGFLRDVNSEFVNTIKGKPAISKQGFRFIQREFEISTESEVVQWSDDPLGCVVWAKAELPNGYSAEAHGEGYQFESDVSDNEFVRYADTRAKNRAISDLTSAGALAVSELQGEE